MDSKIKTFIILACTICSFMLSGCKENNWMDWKVQNEVWLEQNRQDPSVKVTPSGLQYIILADPTPTDAKPNITSYVTYDYTLKLINGYYIVQQGHIDDPSPLSNAISGFAEGCCLVHNNGDIRLFIPYYLGYDQTKVKDNDTYNAVGNEGTEGTQTYIPPYSTLIYDIHICSVSGSN